MKQHREIASVNTGLRLTPGQVKKADALAVLAGVTRNRLIARLIEQAHVNTAQLEIVPTPKNACSDFASIEAILL